jgi:hypothetical protein
MKVHGKIHGKEPPFTLDQFAELLGLFIGVLVFISLLGLDIGNARKKRAHWFPGHGLVLSALIIQVMNLLNAESTLLLKGIYPSSSSSHRPLCSPAS